MHRCLLDKCLLRFTLENLTNPTTMGENYDPSQVHMLNFKVRTYSLQLNEVSSFATNIYVPVSNTTTVFENNKQKILVVSRFVNVSETFDRDVIFTKDIYAQGQVNVDETDIIIESNDTMLNDSFANSNCIIGETLAQQWNALPGTSALSLTNALEQQVSFVSVSSPYIQLAQLAPSVSNPSGIDSYFVALPQNANLALNQNWSKKIRLAQLPLSV
jgi:hypothetical protein